MNKWKRWISAALAAALLLSAVPAGAITVSEAESDGSEQEAAPLAGEAAQDLTYQVPDTNIELTYAVTDGEATITGCNENATGVLTIPQNIGDVPVTAIGGGAFSDLDGLTGVIIPDGVASIGSFAFQNCTNLTSVTLPDGLTSIGSSAFENCDGLTAIAIPDSVTSIDHSAFQYCDNLETVKLPDTLTAIEAFLFRNCTSLADITLPDSVTSIGNSAFSGCTGLTNLTIPDNVTSMGDNVFSHCTSLTGITIPDRVETIGSYAFILCSSLSSINVSTGNTSYCSVDGVLFNRDGTELISYPHGKAVESYVIPDSVTVIADSAFYGSANLTSITIPNTITEIGSTTFAGCTSLTDISIPSSVTIIGPHSFMGCTSLKDITIPDNVTSIGTNAFAGCTNLTNITIPKSVTDMGTGVFVRCTSLTSITIPDSVTSIGDEAFYNCSSLTSITIPNSVTSIGDEAFYNCSSLTDVYYSGSEADWEAIDISSRYNANSVLFSTTIHFNSTGPDNGEEEPAYLTAVFTGYDATNSRVTLDGGTVMQYLVTEQTDKSFLEQLDTVLGHDVLVHVAPTTDLWIYEVRSIVPVELHRGTLNAVDDTSITFDGIAYTNHLAQYGRQNPSALGQTMLYYVLDGAVVDCTLLTHETGSLRAWTVEAGEMTSVTIGTRAYPARLETPLFETSGSSTGLDVEYWIADGTIYAIILTSSTEDIYETKKLLSYDAASGIAVFSDRTQYTANLTEEQRTLTGQWVTVTKQGADSNRITGLVKAVPELVLEITVQDEGDIYRQDGAYSYQETGPFEPASSFEIGYQVRVTNSFPYASADALAEMAQDPSLDLSVEDFRVRAPRDFNFGWTGGGESELEKDFTLHAGETLTGEGYVRPGLWYSPDAERDILLITCSAETALGGLQTVQDGFTIVDLDYEPPATSAETAEQDRVIEQASEQAAQSFAASDAQIILDPNAMREMFGIEGERLDAFEMELLTAVLMSSAPEETFQEELEDALLEKFFGKYKTDLTASSYTVPLTYQIQSPEYGLLTVTFECRVHGYSLSGDGVPYALDATIGYEIVQQADDAPRQVPGNLMQNGQLGEIVAYDVERFAESAYDVAEAEIKKYVYMDTWGNTANEVATILLDTSIQAILDAHGTTFADEFWKLIVWPTKTFVNACPTDLYIYDQSGVLQGAVEDGNITLDSPDFYLSVEDDVKTIRYLKDGYTIRYVATADGVMDVEVTEYLDANTPLRRVAFYQVPLTAGDEFVQAIPSDLLPDAQTYQLQQTGGAALLPDSDERLFVLSSSDEADEDRPSGGGSGSSSGDGSGSSSAEPSVTITSGSYGDVTVTPQDVAPGSTVTITVTPEDGYRLQSLTVTDHAGDVISVTETVSGTYIFTMPETGSVHVEADFVPDIPGSTVEPFRDVAVDAWYADAVRYVYAQGLMRGTDADAFSPETVVDRGMIVTVLYRLAGSPEMDAPLTFTDVTPGAYYADAVRWAASTGIVNGYDEQAFGPEDPITREQLTAMLYRYVRSQGIPVTTDPLTLQAFTDVASISEYAVEAMAWAVDTGLIAGMPDGRLAPGGSALRAQAAVILMRLDAYLDTANQ